MISTLANRSTRSLRQLLDGRCGAATRHMTRHIVNRLAFVAGLSLLMATTAAAFELRITGEWDEPADINELQLVGLQFNVTEDDAQYDSFSFAHVQGLVENATLTKLSLIQSQESTIEWDGFIPLPFDPGDPIGAVSPADGFGPLTAPRLDVETDLQVDEYVRGVAPAKDIVTGNRDIPLGAALAGNTFEAGFLVPGGIPGVAEGPVRLIVEAPISGFNGTMMLRVTNPLGNALFGDYDGDEDADGADFLEWQRALGATGLTPGTGADGSRDGMVDADDLAVWGEHFGIVFGPASEISSANSTIPEPLTVTLSLLAGVGICSESRRRCRRAICQTDILTSLVNHRG